MTSRAAIRRLSAAAVLVAPVVMAQGAKRVPGLYTATVFVTGQGGETRGPALVRAFAAVLVKVSGDPRLAADPAVRELGSDTADFVDSFSYRDRMEGIPVHDEQGSRDRPYDLTVTFAPKAVDAALEALGRAPWSGPRPEILALVAVENGDTRFTLAADGTRGRDMREALAVVAGQYGMPVVLPTGADLAAAGVGEGGLASFDAAPLDMLARANGADMVVSGTLAWNDADLGWDAEWQLSADRKPYRWSVHRVSFDNAFRSAIGGAAQILSGHGAPD